MTWIREVQPIPVRTDKEDTRVFPQQCHCIIATPCYRRWTSRCRLGIKIQHLSSIAVSQSVTAIEYKTRERSVLYSYFGGKGRGKYRYYPVSPITRQEQTIWRQGQFIDDGTAQQ